MQRRKGFSGSHSPIVLPSMSVTLGFIVVITMYIYFVVFGVFGKGFPVDYSPCIYLIFLFRPFTRDLISYFALLGCGCSHTRGTWVDDFFPGAGWISVDGVCSLPYLARHVVFVPSSVNKKHMKKKKSEKKKEWDLGHEPSPLHTWRSKNNHHEN